MSIFSQLSYLLPIIKKFKQCRRCGTFTYNLLLGHMESLRQICSPRYLKYYLNAHDDDNQSRSLTQTWLACSLPDFACCSIVFSFSLFLSLFSYERIPWHFRIVCLSISIRHCVLRDDNVLQVLQRAYTSRACLSLSLSHSLLCLFF